MNLEDLMTTCKRTRFSEKTVCMIGIDMVDHLRRVHKLHYLYRDVKPENIVIGGDFENYNKIYLIDFGLSKSYTNAKGNHIDMK